MKALAGLLTIALLLLSAVVCGQESIAAMDEVNYSYFGAGARAFAMGNAFVGLSNDASSGTWNPAGMWVIESPVVAGSYLLYAPVGEFTDSRTPVATQNRMNIKTFGSFSFATPVRIKNHPWVFNFNFIRNNDYANEFRYFSGFDSEPEINPDSYILDMAHMKSFRFGMTTRIYRQLSGGFTVNVYDGRRYTEGVQEAAWVTMRYEIPPVPDSISYVVRRIDSTSSSGVNFTLGLLYKMEKFSVGTVIHTPFKLKNSTDFQYSETLIRNGLVDDFFSDALYVDDSIAKQDMPLTIALGFAFLPTEKMTLTMDLNYQNFESVQLHLRDSFNIDASGERTDFYTKYDIDWNNTFGIGAGMEYMLDTKLGRIPLRTGFRYDQWPKPKDEAANIEPIYDDENELIGATIERSYGGRRSSVAFSLGTGFHFSQIEIDLAWRYQSGDERNISERVEGLEYDAKALKIRAHEFRGTLTGHF